MKVYCEIRQNNRKNTLPNPMVPMVNLLTIRVFLKASKIKDLKFLYEPVRRIIDYES